MGWIKILLHKLKGENVVLRGQDFDLLVNFSLAQELNWRQLWSAVLHRSKPYQVRRAGNTKCSSSFFWAWPPHNIQMFSEQKCISEQFQSFFPPFSSYVSFHDWFTASVGTRDTMKLQDFDAVENTCNFTSTTAVSCWSDSRSSICSVDKCLNTGDDSQLHYISLAKSLSGPHQEPRAKIVQNMWKLIHKWKIRGIWSG